MAAEDAGKKAAEHGVKSIDVEVRGPGSGRESALRALQAVGFSVTSIRDVTPIPHNGCRPAPVMWDRCDITDGCNRKPNSLKCTQS